MAHPDRNQSHLPNPKDLGKIILDRSSRMLVIATLSLGLSGCSFGKPSQEKIRSAVLTALAPTPTVMPTPHWQNIIETVVAQLPSTPTATGTPTTTPTATAEPTKFETKPLNLKTVILHDSDGNEVTVSLPKNFTPDKDLKISDINALNVLPIPNDAADFQKFLNTPNNPTSQPLAGYMYGTNDYNQYKDRQSGPQLPMYAWLIHTGEIVDIPGIGRVEGSPGKAVMVLIINRTDKVYQWAPNTVYVKSGFQGAGRIWNGETPFVQEAERRLTQHYAYILGNGHPESGFIGQCDLPENCHSVTAVSVERIQWGNNPNGSPRYQFRLIRAEDIALK